MIDRLLSSAPEARSALLGSGLLLADFPWTPEETPEALLARAGSWRQRLRVESARLTLRPVLRDLEGGRRPASSAVRVLDHWQASITCETRAFDADALRLTLGGAQESVHGRCTVFTPWDHPAEAWPSATLVWVGNLGGGLLLAELTGAAVTAGVDARTAARGAALGRVIARGDGWRLAVFEA